MKLLHTALVISMVVFAFGCAEMQTAERKLDQVVLLDVQGYSGGTNLWISKDGKAICIVAVPPKKGETGLQDTRYEFVLSEQQRSSLIQLITKNRFFTRRIQAASAIGGGAVKMSFGVA
jgi:hypothetical protein